MRNDKKGARGISPNARPTSILIFMIVMALTTSSVAVPLIAPLHTSTAFAEGESGVSFPSPTVRSDGLRATELHPGSIEDLVGFAAKNPVALLKLFGILAAAFFGALGLGRDTRDNDGRLTSHGYVALVGVVVAAFLTLGTELMELRQHQDEQKKEEGRLADEVARQAAILSDVRRGLVRLEGITVELEIKLSGTDPKLASFVASLDRYLTTIERVARKLPAEKLVSDKRFHPTILPSGLHELKDSVYGATVFFDSSRRPERVYFDANSKLFPRKLEGGIITRNELDNYLYSYLTPLFTLAFVRSPGPFDQAEVLFGRSPTVELSLVFGSRKEQPTKAVYSPSEKILHLTTLTPNANSWEHHGSILSLLDLPGMYVLVQTPFAAQVAEIEKLSISPTVQSIRGWATHMEFRGAKIHNVDINGKRCAIAQIQAENLPSLGPLMRTETRRSEQSK